MTPERALRHVVCSATLAGLILALASPRAGLSQESLADDPLAVCSRALIGAWSALDSRAGAGLTEAQLTALDAGIEALDTDRRCALLSTTAEHTYLRGRRALATGRAANAGRQLEAALGAPHVRAGDRPTRAEILYYLGLAHEARGDGETARTTYIELATEHPADARVALVLPLLEHAAATSPEERLAAATQAEETHNYSAAQRLLERIVADALGRPVEPADPAFVEALRQSLPDADETTLEATYRLGYLWYYWIRRLNHQSIPLLQAVADLDRDHAANAAYFLARAYMREEDYPAAREAWAAFEEQHPGDRRVHEATYYRGWLYLDREDFEAALPGFEDYLDRFPRGSRVDRAVWYLGWTLFRLERFEDARQAFRRLADEGGYLEGAKGRYWEGRCFRKEGDEAAATAAFEEVADRYAFTYYGLLSRQRLGLPLVPPRDHAVPPAPRDRLLELAARRGSTESLAAVIEEGDVFHTARYYEDRHPERLLNDELDALLVQQAAGDAYDTFRESRGHSGWLLRRPPSSESALLHWVRRYPRPYDRWVVPAAESAGPGSQAIDPLLIWAHMQIESHYNTRFISYADAQGLLQIIPKTGQRIAAALGEPYLEGMMMSPEVNLRYGAWYLGALIDELGGQLPLAMSAYNAGAASMQRWIDENHDLPFDAFVEEIPYDQSREYLKKVVGMYVHYLYLYAEDEHLDETLERLFPEQIDPDYAGEIDY